MNLADLITSVAGGVIKAGVEAAARRDLDDAQKIAHFWQRLDEEVSKARADQARIDAAVAAAEAEAARIRNALLADPNE